MFVFYAVVINLGQRPYIRNKVFIHSSSSRSSARTQEVANVGTSSSDLHLTDFTYETLFLQFMGS